MQFEITVTDDGVAWNAYVAAHPQATQYHQYEWSGLIANSFGHQPIALAAYMGDRIVGILPLILMDSWLFGRRIVSLPFVNYGGVLADAEEIEQILWDRAVALACDKQVSCLEARHVSQHSFIQHRKHHKVTLILDLAPSIEAQWRAFDAKVRNQIRKAERSGLTVKSGGAAELPGFYEVFARNMRDLGTPVFGRRYFEQVLHTFPESSRVFCVESGPALIAAGIALSYRDTVEVPWAAWLREYRSMCPNNLLYWAVMQYAMQMGCRRFDFGRSTPGDGPYKFKEQWGARSVPLAWEYWMPDAKPWPDVSPKNPKYGAAIQIWKHLPFKLTKWLGPAIVRGIPA